MLTNATHAVRLYSMPSSLVLRNSNSVPGAHACGYLRMNSSTFISLRYRSVAIHKMMFLHTTCLIDIVALQPQPPARLELTR